MPVARRPVTCQVSMIYASDGGRKAKIISGPVGPTRGASPSKTGTAMPIQVAFGAPLLNGHRAVMRYPPSTFDARPSNAGALAIRGEPSPSTRAATA